MILHPNRKYTHHPEDMLRIIQELRETQHLTSSHVMSHLNHAKYEGSFMNIDRTGEYLFNPYDFLQFVAKTYGFQCVSCSLIHRERVPEKASRVVKEILANLHTVPDFCISYCEENGECIRNCQRQRLWVYWNGIPFQEPASSLCDPCFRLLERWIPSKYPGVTSSNVRLEREAIQMMADHWLTWKLTHNLKAAL
jgi:hypothetical protein